MYTPEEKEDNPLIIERGDGRGWTFNFYNKWSYPVLILFLAAIGAIIWWMNIWISNSH